MPDKNNFVIMAKSFRDRGPRSVRRTKLEATFHSHEKSTKDKTNDKMGSARSGSKHFPTPCVATGFISVPWTQEFFCERYGAGRRCLLVVLPTITGGWRHSAHKGNAIAIKSLTQADSRLVCPAGKTLQASQTNPTVPRDFHLEI